ncbi:MFS transporter, UMF1 family, partial [Tremellales sp. Uapishka_1]
MTPISLPSPHVRAWYSYAFAAEVYSACALAIFIPITLEHMAKEVGYISPEYTIPCAGTENEGVCKARILGVWVDTASFSMYVKSLAVAIQAICIISIGPLADSPLAYLGSLSAVLFLLLPSTSPVLAATLNVVGSIGYAVSIVCANAFLPVLAREDAAVVHTQVQEGEGGEDEEEERLLSPVIDAISTQDLADGDRGTTHRSTLLSLTTSRLSSTATALGFLSGVSVLTLLLIPVTVLDGSIFSLRLAIGLSGIWWAVFTIPAWIGLPTGTKEERGAVGGWQRVAKMVSWTEIRQLSNLYTFLLAWVFLSDGFHTTTYTAILYASSTLSLPASKIALIGILVQLSAVFSAILSPRFQRYLQCTNMKFLVGVVVLAEALPLYACVGLVLPFGGLRTEGEMYVAAVWFGLLYGPFNSCWMMEKEVGLFNGSSFPSLALSKANRSCACVGHTLRDRRDKGFDFILFFLNQTIASGASFRRPHPAMEPSPSSLFLPLALKRMRMTLMTTALFSFFVHPLSSSLIEAPPKGRTIGDTPGSKKSSQEDVDFRADKTPSAKAKVLPWVMGVQSETEGYVPPMGMLGPYDSRKSKPPTRPATMIDGNAPPSKHPFAYNADSTIPFSALLGGQALPLAQSVKRNTRPESEVLSRGAGMRHLNQTSTVPGGHTYDETQNNSPGMGTFGRQASMEPPKLASPISAPRRIPPPRSVRQPPTEPLPPSPIKSHQSPDPGAQTPPDTQPHVHHPHHDYPFSLQEAARKQQDAMELARAQALAQLESQPFGAGILPLSGENKGPRGTYTTSTSGPSFGHLVHQNGLPRHLSLQSGTEPFSMHIPFGVPAGFPIQRPMMVMRNSAGVGLGIAVGGGSRGLAGVSLNPGLTGVQEMTEEEVRKEDRSAYVETVDDEEAPTVITAKTGAKTQKSAVPTYMTGGQDPAKPESAIQPRYSTTAPPGTRAPTARAQSVAAESRAPPRVAERSPTRAAESRAPTVAQSRAPTRATAPSIKAPSDRRVIQQSHQDYGPGFVKSTTFHEETYLMPTKTATKAPSVATQGREQATIQDAQSPSRTERPLQLSSPPSASMAPPRPVSFAPTTASNVAQMVADSRYHDEALCQLLDAARLNLIGEEAKKALRRAAKARVIELRDLREQGEEAIALPARVTTPKKETPKKDSPKKSTPRSKAGLSPRQDITSYEPASPPAWAKDIINRLAAIDVRFNELDKTRAVENEELPHAHGEVANDIINDLLFNEFPSTNMPHFNLSALGFPNVAYPGPEQFHPPGAYIRDASPSIRDPPRDLQNQDMSWGSEVDLPAPGENVPPPKGPPTINILAPTASNVEGGSTRAPTRTPTRASNHTPRQVDVDIVEEQVVPVTDAAYPLTDKDLPAAPSESIRSNLPSSPIPFSTSVRTAPPRSAPRTPEMPKRAPSPSPSSVIVTPKPKPVSPRPISTDREKYRMTDPRLPHMDFPAPWEIVTQRLYSWALVWEEESFVRALEKISLGQQVEEFPLTVFVMMTFKRNLRHRMTNVPPLPCDKLFVPPNMADNINRAVHSQRFADAQQILEELWERKSTAFRMGTIPRVIVAVVRHRNQADIWTAHRFDLTTGHLTSYCVHHDDDAGLDGRPFMWWHAIRAAWPSHQIPHPEHLRQRFEHVRTQYETRNNNSLIAANTGRNLLLGWRPERPTDLAKLRELIWMETKRCLKRKRQGTLIISMDGPEHVYEI